MTTRQAKLSRIISYFFMVLATTAIVVGYVRLDNNQQAIRDEAAFRAKDVCAILNQVKEAVSAVAKPVPEVGVTDPATLARIRIANAQRAEARRILAEKLACPKVT